MVVAADVAAIFADAHGVYQSALERLAAGDLRDSAEKAWRSTKRATDALLLARTGEAPQKSPQTSRMLNVLARNDPGVMTLVDRYYARQSQLHGECFYLGLCEPADATERRIRETAAYIRDAERLAYQ